MLLSNPTQQTKEDNMTLLEYEKSITFDDIREVLMEAKERNE